MSIVANGRPSEQLLNISSASIFANKEIKENDKFWYSIVQISSCQWMAKVPNGVKTLRKSQPVE